MPPGDKEIGLQLTVTAKGAVELLDRFRKKVKETEATLVDAAKTTTRTSQQQTQANKQQTRSAEETTRAVGKLAMAQRDMGNAMTFAFVKAQLLVGVLKGAFRTALSAVIGPIRAINNLLQSMIKRVVQATERFDRFRITLEGALKSATRSTEISEFVQEFALRTPVRVEQLQDLTKSIALIPALRPQFFGDLDKVKDNLSELFDTVIGLSSLNPQQGIPGT